MIESWKNDKQIYSDTLLLEKVQCELMNDDGLFIQIPETL